MSNPEAIETQVANEPLRSLAGAPPAPPSAAGQVAILTVEEVAGLNRMLQAAVDNFTAQGKINDQVVSRLLGVEKQLKDLDARVTQSLQKGVQERLPVYLGNNLVLCRVLDSFLMYVHTRDILLTAHLLANGCWQPAQTRVFSQLVKRGMRVVEVGAQTGYFTLLAAAGAGPEGRVTAFEPEPINFELLNLNLQVNGLSGQVRTFTVAASGKRGTGGRTERQRKPKAASKPAPAAIAPLDELAASSAEVLKLSAGGKEPEIFAGMNGLLQRSPNLTVMMEFVPSLLQRNENSPQDFLRSLRAAGFQVRAMTPQATLRPASDESLLGAASSTLLLSRS
jgi:FkbM family methyltransferase